MLINKKKFLTCLFFADMLTNREISKQYYSLRKGGSMIKKVFFLFTVLIVLVSCTKTTEPENSAPYVPDSPFPSNGATAQALDVVLRWSGGDPDHDPVTYDIYFGTNSPPPLVVSNQVGRSYDPGILDYTTQYYWRIISEDDHDHSSEGSTWHFTTGNTPPMPLNLSIRADAEGNGVILSWDQASNIDGYTLITPDSNVIVLFANDTSYTDDTPLTTGTYSLYSVYDSTLSDPATINDVPHISTSDAVVYVMGSGHPSGYGWDILTGIGSVYFCDGGNASVVDFYLYSDSLTFDFYSGDQVPYSGDKTTDILDMGTTNFFIAPETGYSSSATVVSGDYYAMKVEGNYYAKVYILSTNAISATFNYEFQLIQSLRLF